MATRDSKDDGRAQLRIKSDPQQLVNVREFFRLFTRGLGLGADELDQLNLAVDEAITNIIRHGYDGDTTKPIDITLETKEVERGKRALSIIISDEAKTVDPLTIKGRDLDDIRPGGLGVHLIRSIMDEVTYVPGNQGMTLEMTKYI